jgi:hypothetical protein
MRRSRLTIPRVYAGLMIALSFAISAIPLDANGGGESNASSQAHGDGGGR